MHNACNLKLVIALKFYTLKHIKIAVLKVKQKFYYYYYFRKSALTDCGESGCSLSERRPQPHKANPPQKEPRERENNGR